MSEKTEIKQLGAEVLRQRAQAVDDFTAQEFHALIDDLLRAMAVSEGVGIAAPQIGVSWQVIVIASRPTARYPHAPEMAPLVMINPRYQVVDDTVCKDWEGCLSVPGIRALVPRFRAVAVDYQDVAGTPHTIELSDFPARVFQHEFDHLEGLVYLDRVETNHDIVAESEFFKRMAA